MDMRSWKKVLLQWISECSFAERNYFNIEQSDIDAFYQNFSLKHQKTATEEIKHLGDFLKEFYPNFEFNFDDENCLSSADYIYVYSLLLHFCCVKHPETVFHEICQRLPDYAQQCIASFFKVLVDTIEPITKETLRHAIAEVANHCTPPRLNDSSYSCSVTNISTGGQSPASRSRCGAGESPLKTPKRSVNSQRVSPSTPKTYLLEERTRELFNLRAQLETERYEKGILEAQIKQNEDKIQKLNLDHRRLLQQIQELKNDIFSNDSTDESSNNDNKEYQIQQRLRKELANKEQEISRLTDMMRNLQEQNTLVVKERNKAEKEKIICKNSMKELDLKLEELKEELEKRNTHIDWLTARQSELEQFIEETRTANGNAELNESADCMDGSFLRNSNNTNNSHSVSSPENLGVSVIDVQLREKEHENKLLKEELRNVKCEHKRLAKHISKLTEEYDLPLDSSSPIASEMSEADNEMFEEEEIPAAGEDLENNKICGEQQFSLYKYCMEKINKFQKSEKNKVKSLEQETINLQEENQDLATKLEQLKNEIENLKSELNAKEKLHKALESTKEEIEMSLKKSLTDLQNIERQKAKLHEDIQSLEHNNQILNENIEELKAQLELQQKEYSELLDNNRKLKENEESLERQLCEVKKELMDKSLQWQEELEKSNETMAMNKEEIAMYKQRETTIKCNFEQIVVQNEELKKDNRVANTHLSEMKKLLMDKEKQMGSLGEKLNELKEKNQNLEQHIDDLLQAHMKDNVKNQTVQTDIDNQLKKLKDQLSKTSLLMESKQHECDLKQKQLKDLEMKVTDIQKLFGKDSVKANIFMNIAEIEIKVKNLINIKTELINEIQVLKEKQVEDQTVIEEFNQDVKEKMKIVKHSEEKLALLKNKYEKSETVNENLKEELRKTCKNYDAVQEELQDLRKLKEEAESELNQHKQAHKAAVEKLQNDIKEAQIIYQTSLERLDVQLKIEKEEHNVKQMELIVIKADYNEVKKKLQEKERELEKLQIDNQRMQESYERLKEYEIKVTACTTENDKLRYEIETFKQEVTQNALRLLEADKALAEYMELTKQQDAVRSEAVTLRAALNEKEQLNHEMELKYNEQLEQQNDLLCALQEQLGKLAKDKDRMTKEIEEKTQQILKEQQDKLMLLNSLEKSTDQLKLATKDKQQQMEALEQRLKEIKTEFDSITFHNTKLQHEIEEREVELRLRRDEQQQEKADFQQKLSQLMQDLSKKSIELEVIDTELMEAIVIAENNFNLTQEVLKNDQFVENIFNYNEMESQKSTQKLRQQFNYVLHKQQQLLQQLNEMSNEKEKVLETANVLRENNAELQTKCNQHEETLTELRELMVTEEAIMEKRIYQEVKRLEEDLLNLENVNERLANENVTIQLKLGNAEQDLKDSKQQLHASEEECRQVKEQLSSKSVIVEKLQQEEKKLQQSLKEKQLQMEKIIEKSKSLEVQLKEKTSKYQNLEKESQELKEKANKNQQKLAYYQQLQQNQQAEHKKLQDKIKMWQSSVESMELEIDKLNKEILALKNENSTYSQQQKDLRLELHLSSNKLDEMITSKLIAETKCEELQSEVTQLKRDLELDKAQQQLLQDDYNHLLQEIDSFKKDKEHLRDEVNENKITLQRANENVAQLIQQIISIRQEKEAASDEIQLLRKHLEETGKHQTTSEAKMKSIIERSQDFESKLLAAEKELKHLKVNFEKTEAAAGKLQTENKKLRDSQEVSTKRIEKLALKLGDSQARSAKLERDNEKLSRTLEAHTVTVEALQKDKDLLQGEAKSLKERLSRAERCQEQLTANSQTLEHQITNLQQIKQKLEATEIDNRTKINKLEKLKEVNEDKLRKLTNTLNNAENTNVKLNLEVGSLNSELQKLKAELKQAQQEHQEMEELKKKLNQALDLAGEYEDVNEKLKIEIDNLKEENFSINDQLSKTSLSLQITSKKYENIISELEQIRAEILIIREEKSQIELQYDTSVQKLSKIESENAKLINERENLVKSLQQRITHLEEQLKAKTNEVADLQKEIDILKKNTESHASDIQQTTRANLTELKELRAKLSLAENTRQEDQQIISELRLDNQILHTKYQESKKRASDAEKLCEDRIKENRLELEGKLEKMKSKMKTLYTEEITKMKTKQDREMATVKSEMEVLKAQNAKYEEHTRKLSSQIVRLNDNILQHQKENTILSTKLRHVIEQQQQLHDNDQRNKRRSSIHISTISSTSNGPVIGGGGPNNIGTNLAMEDEEGEVFNNTYLTDLKNGGMTELMSREVPVEELKYRNSLLPPHLRSAYAAQFDNELSEDDLKDGPHSFDDSMSALLSTTAGGTRKKCTGVTHYKRPGPPTPSKNGGRLSFGGISEPSREILKESYDTNAVSSSKTPARFKVFASRFSMGQSKDEKSNVIKKDTDEYNLRKNIFKAKGNNCKLLTEAVGCTSTPRKSKVHYDQRRLLDQLMKSSPSPSPLALDNKVIKVENKLTTPDRNISETPLTALCGHEKITKAEGQKTMMKRLEAIASGLRRNRRSSCMYGRRLSRRIQEICTPTSSETTSPALLTPLTTNHHFKKQVVVVVNSSATTSGGISKSILLKKRLRNKPKRERKTRPSLYLKGNIFAKYKCRTPNKTALHDLNRYKSRKQRLEHFNQGRNMISFKCQSSPQTEEPDETLSNCQTNVTYDIKNNNLATLNGIMGATVIVAKCEQKSEKKPEDTFTFGEEQFENPNTVEISDYVEDEDYDEIDTHEEEEITEEADHMNLSLTEESNDQELVTSQDLENFDRFIAAHIPMENKQENYIDDDYSSQGSSHQFEQLLIKTQSNAPFEVNHIKFNNTPPRRRLSNIFSKNKK